MPEIRISQDLIKKVTSIVKKLGVTKVLVFGSVARGESHAGSDLDLLVEFEKGRTLIDLIAVEEELTKVIGKCGCSHTPQFISSDQRECAQRRH